MKSQQLTKEKCLGKLYHKGLGIYYLLSKLVENITEESISYTIRLFKSKILSFGRADLVVEVAVIFGGHVSWDLLSCVSSLVYGLHSYSTDLSPTNFYHLIAAAVKD